MRQDRGAEHNAIRNRGRGLHHRDDARRVLQRKRDRADLFHTRNAIDDMLDAVQLDADTRHLHLAVVSSDEPHLAPLIHPADVAGAHKRAGRLAGQFKEFFGAHFAVDIAERRRRACDQKLAPRMARRWREGVRIRNHESIPGQRSAERNGAVFRGRDATHRRQDRGFGRPIAIDHGQSGRRFTKPPRKAARKYFADKHQRVKATRARAVVARAGFVRRTVLRTGRFTAL
ncbi:MAG TPA: hypothetical protein VGN21_00005, partial [Stellaceae bacterium]